jgi:hypothetical protein
MIAIIEIVREGRHLVVLFSLLLGDGAYDYIAYPFSFATGRRRDRPA